MRRGYFNWKLALVLVLAVVVVAATAVGLRQYQKTGRAAAALKVGNAAYEQGDWDEAASNLGRYIGLHQEDVSALMKYAHAQLRRRPATGGHVQQAIAAYRNVLRADRSNAEAAQRLCEVYLAPAVASPGEAELIASRYLNDNPGPHPEIRYLLGAAMARLGRFDQARQEWAAVIEASPGYAPAYEAMGRLAEERPADANEPASHWFDLAVQRDPNSAGARIARAGFHARQGRSAEAIADLEAAESKDLSDYEVRIRLAQQWLQAGDLGRARAHLEALAQTSPSEVTLWQTWAELAMRMQSTEVMGEVADKGMAA
nr:tetratricopeptide repeat protein [Phycisphaerae bacterium]